MWNPANFLMAEETDPVNSEMFRPNKKEIQLAWLNFQLIQLFIHYLNLLYPVWSYTYFLRVFVWVFFHLSFRESVCDRKRERGMNFSTLCSCDRFWIHLEPILKMNYWNNNILASYWRQLIARIISLYIKEHNNFKPTYYLVHITYHSSVNNLKKYRFIDKQNSFDNSGFWSLKQNKICFT